MTDDISELVVRLRELHKGCEFEHFKEAADALERLKTERDDAVYWMNQFLDRAEQAEAELREEYDCRHVWQERAEKAEAKVAQLEKVIEELNRAVARSETL